jgi:hypothetical protein
MPGLRRVKTVWFPAMIIKIIKRQDYRINSMKFQQLKIGQQFEYKGEGYIKDGPVMALHQASGKKVLIPRSAELLPAEATAAAQAAQLPGTISSDVLVEALNNYEARCLELFEAIAADIGPDKRHQLLAELKRARESFMQSITP